MVPLTLYQKRNHISWSFILKPLHDETGPKILSFTLIRGSVCILWVSLLVPSFYWKGRRAVCFVQPHYSATLLLQSKHKHPHFLSLSHGFCFFESNLGHYIQHITKYYGVHLKSACSSPLSHPNIILTTTRIILLKSKLFHAWFCTNARLSYHTYLLHKPGFPTYLLPPYPGLASDLKEEVTSRICEKFLPP